MQKTETFRFPKKFVIDSYFLLQIDNLFMYEKVALFPTIKILKTGKICENVIFW